MRDTSPAPSSGLLSNVFGYLSREVETFVATATGGSAPNSRSSSRSRRRRGDAARPDVERSNERDSGTHVPRETSPGLSETSVTPDVSQNSGYRTCSSQDNTDGDLRQHGFTNADGSSPTHDLRRRRMLSVTMPGSLYPRSPSLVPDETRRVRFASAVTNPLKGPTSSPSPVHEDPSTPSSSHKDPTTRTPAAPGAFVPDNPFTSPRPGVPSVKDAVRQFNQTTDAIDLSLMLPSPTISPSRKQKADQQQRAAQTVPGPNSVGVPQRTQITIDGMEEDQPEATSPKRWKGKERLYDFSFDVDPDSSGMMRMRGKEKELVDAREEHREKEQKRRISGVTIEDDIERSRDKVRIKALEEEIQQLRAELAKRSIRQSSIQPGSMPPPPPPPPLMSTAGTFITRQTPSTSHDSVLTAARAALKHTAAPVEAPINVPGLGAGSRAKRTGQPTVNISGDKMESFLNEVRSVKLRKVGDNPTPGANHQVQPHGPVPLRRRATTDAGITEEFRRTWLDGVGNTTVGGHEVTLGKRKRGGAGEEAQGLECRHETAPNMAISSLPTSSSTFHASSSVLSSSTSALPLSNGSRVVRVPQRVLVRPDDPLRSSVSGPPPTSRPSAITRNYPIPPRLAPVTQSLPSASTVVTTPSLCSDNEGDQELDSASDEQTPPAYAAEVVSVVQPPVQPRRALSLEISPRHASARAQDQLDKRKPSSSTLLKTPRKPRPPGRRSVSATHASDPPEPSSDVESNDDPLLLNFSPYNRISAVNASFNRVHRQPSPLPALDLGLSVGSSKDRSVHPQRGTIGSVAYTSQRILRHSTSSQGPRPDTFSDELERALQNGRHAEDIVEDDFDSGVLVGVGTRNKKRGFLAHGGAGGVPVFMGVGYVDGAEDVDSDVEPEPSVPVRRAQDQRVVTFGEKSRSRRRGQMYTPFSSLCVPAQRDRGYDVHPSICPNGEAPSLSPFRGPPVQTVMLTGLADLDGTSLHCVSEETRACIRHLQLHEPERSDLSNLPKSRLAAVLVLLYEKAGELRVLLTQRSASLRTHAGQTALPGGRVDDTDADYVETAFREAYEEIGLPLDCPQVHMLCCLRPFVSLNKLLVTPVVAFLDDLSVLERLVPSQHEVAKIFDHPLRGFLDPSVVAPRDLVPIGSEDWPYEVELHSTSDSILEWLDGTGYRMHRFRSTASPIKGLTADIMILVATIAFDEHPQYARYAPGQATGFWAVWKALLAMEAGTSMPHHVNHVVATQQAVIP